MKKLFKSDNGFTLMEITIVIALILLTSAFGTISYKKVFTDTVKSSSSQVVSALRDARYKSTTDISKTYKLLFTKSSDTYGYKIVRVSDDAIIEEKLFKKNITIKCKKNNVEIANINTVEIKFTSLGQLETKTDNYSIEITGGRTDETIKIDVVGFTGRAVLTNET